MAKGSRRGRVGSINILFIESPADSGRIFANKPRLVAPFYDGNIYIWFYLVLRTVTQYLIYRL